MANLFVFRIVTIPDPLPEDLPTRLLLAQKFHTLRLDSLVTNPEAYGSSYESEKDRTLEETLERWRVLTARQIIAVRDPNVDRPSSANSSDDLDVLLKSDWVGMIVLVGPQDFPPGSAASGSVFKDPFKRNQADVSRKPENDGTESKLRYTINATYVHPSARRRGLGEALMQHGLRLAREKSLSLGHASSFVDLAVNFANAGARSFYESAGFRVIGQEKYTQRPRMIDGVLRELELEAWEMAVELQSDSSVSRS